jgi:UDP-GlcNAc:undecaprenyl-phosphate GlcNAc-1-phosphate transferase
MLEEKLLLGFFFATALVFWGTPVAIRVAARLDFYDRPIGYKGHGAPTPYLGGAPVVLAFVAVVAILTNDWQRTLPVASGVVALWALGTLDDRRTVSPAVRVAAEATCATLLFAAGDGWDFGGAPAVGLLVTIVWVVAVVNALNLFDNMDGAASTIALVISAGVAVTGALQGDVWLAVAAAALCGACLGFLPHNLAKPARIFLGDGGSMPVGFALAAIVMLAAGSSGPAWQALAIGILLVGVLVVDTCLVIVSRTRRGISILTGGRDHLTHRTFQRLQTTRAVAFALGSVQALLATLALFASRKSSGLLLLVVLLYLVGAAATIAVFDRRGPEAKPVAIDENEVAGRQLRPELWVLALLGAGAGISPFFGAFYDQAIWAPLGLGLVVVLIAVAIAFPARLRRSGALALSALAALGLLALLSSSWAGSATNASVNGNRYLVYAAFLALVMFLIRDARGAAVLVASFAVGALVVAGADLVQMASGEANQLFVNGRLHEPLGYINGQGSFFLLAAWPCIALAERVRRRWLAGVSLGAATVLLGLATMAQSRGVILAAVVSLLVALVALPGRRRRAVALTLVCAGVGATLSRLLDLFHSTTATGAISETVARDAAISLVVAGVAVAVLWWTALSVEKLLRTRSAPAFRGVRLAVTAVYAIAVVAALTVALLDAGRLGNTVDREYTAFVHLDPTQGSDSSAGRLVSGGGNRFDYWRVAANTWTDHPLVGVGGGNYPEPYYRTRQTAEAILQPHSIELQTLSELGLGGAALLVLIVLAVLIGVVGARRRARGSGLEHVLMVAGVGTLTAWGVHASVDWMHLLPGLTAAALIAVAVLLRLPQSPARSAEPDRARWRRPVLVGVSSIVIALAAVSLTRQTLADWFRSNAQDALQRSPADAITWANRSLRLDPDAPTTYYVKAAALARFQAAGPAEKVLRTAVAREPGNFLTYALLGDLYTREGRDALAAQAYRAALTRNPRDPTLIALAAKSKARVSGRVR